MFTAATQRRHPSMSDARFNEVLEDLGSFLCDVDLETFQVHSVTRQAELILGYPAEDWTSDNSFLETHLHPDDREETLARIRQEAGRGRKCVLDLRMIAADGHPVWLRVVARPPLPESKGRA